MSDVALAMKHYRYDPEGLPAGVYQTPHYGEVCTGEIIEVRADLAAPFDGSPDFKKASQKDYDKQPAHEILVSELRKPHLGEEA